jgi:hypothetical protein
MEKLNLKKFQSLEITKAKEIKGGGRETYSPAGVTYGWNSCTNSLQVVSTQDDAEIDYLEDLL